MNAPEIIIIIAWGVNIGIHLIKHGEKKKESKYNVFIEIVGAIIAYFFLRWAGLFQ